MASAQHIIVWEGLEIKSSEYLSWQWKDDILTATGHISGVAEQSPFVISYTIYIDNNWNTRGFSLSDLLHPANSFYVESDGKGKWSQNGSPVTIAEGCLDIDFSLSVFTNTLPIRRLNWDAAREHTLQAFYIDLPDFRIGRAEQRYTKTGDGTYLFEQPDVNFSSEITVDAEGLVIHYPGIAKRIFPSNTIE